MVVYLSSSFGTNALWQARIISGFDSIADFFYMLRMAIFRSFRSSHFQGFSLVELSIVLVILGLFVGGLLGGKALIRASELRSVAVEEQGYVAAARAFRDKYFALPGDINNATQIWGVSSDCTLGDTSGATCNGNGDGFVRSLYSPNNMTTGALFGSGNNEAQRFWQHLALGGFIEGQYNGVSEEPKMKVNRSVSWGVNDLASAVSGRANMFNGTYRNLFFAGPDLTPNELWEIDTKIDDGKPAYGKLIAYAGPALFGTPNLTTCTDAAVVPYGAQLTASYLLSGSTAGCQLIFNYAF